VSAPTIVIECSPGETRGALLRANAVWDVMHHRDATPSLVGGVYRGRVRRVDNGLNGAFVDIGTGADAFLRARDAAVPGERNRRHSRISDLVHEGAALDVEIVADGFADKGPRIARTAGAKPGGNAPAVLVPPPSAVAQILARFADSPAARIICGDAAVEGEARSWAAEHMPELDTGISRDGGGPFTSRGIEDAIAAALERRVRVAGGAELVFDTAEALCVIDVNSSSAPGKGGRAARDVNLKVMPEIARQLRLRNIAGAVVIDALRMAARDDRNRVLAALRSALKGDPAACHVLGVTNLGLIELTRTRTGLTLAERMLAPAAEPQPAVDAVAYDALRAAVRAGAATPSGGYVLHVAPEVAEALEGRLRDAAAAARRTLGALEIVGDAARTRARFEVVLGSARTDGGAT
jgi:ribonuclease G